MGSQSTSRAAKVWSAEARGVFVGLGLILSLILLGLGWRTESGTSVPREPAPGLVVDPNTAPAEILLALPGLGPGLVQKWIEARDERPFQSLDDIARRVRGIGPVTLARIVPYLEISAQVSGQ